MTTSSRRARWLAPPVVVMLAVGALAALAAPASAVRNTFTNDNGVVLQDFFFEENTTSITINDAAAATPYPSTISMTDLGIIRDVNVSLNSVDHAITQDVDILLVGPGGRQVTLFSDAGIGATDDDLTFDDEATDLVPENAPIASGTYRPTNYAPLNDAYPASAPASNGATSLSVFDGHSTQGLWRLYVVDDFGGFSGDISGGWSITFSLRSVPYPSPITVTGLGTKISDVNVSLGGLTHSFPADLDFLLVGPGGQQATIMSDSGGGSPVDSINVTLDDEAAAPLPNGLIASGTYRPTNLPTLLDAYPPPAPASTGTSALSVFDGTNPNGQWKLFAVDAAGADQGILSNWSLDVETDGAAPTGTVTINGGAATAASTAVTLNLTASDPGTPTTGVTEVRLSNDNVSFSPFQPFAAAVPWTLANGDGPKTVFAQFKDASGNVSGSVSDTITLDTGGPHSTKTTPKDGAEKVSKTTKVKITASEDLTASTVTKGTVILKQKGGSKVKCKVSYNATKHQITLKPKDDLKKGKTYKVTVKTSVTDLIGNAWDEKAFTAGPQPLKFTFQT